SARAAGAPAPSASSRRRSAIRLDAAALPSVRGAGLFMPRRCHERAVVSLGPPPESAPGRGATDGRPLKGAGRGRASVGPTETFEGLGRRGTGGYPAAMPLAKQGRPAAAILADLERLAAKDVDWKA